MSAAADLAELVPLLDDALLDRVDGKSSLKRFVELAWSQIEPTTPLVWTWHLDVLCERLEAVTRREIRDLVVSVPPGTSKSLIASVLWPAWVWTIDPGHRWITTSYSDKVVSRDAERMRGLVRSPWYQSRWPEAKIPSDRAQSDSLRVFRTTAGGLRYSTTVRGQLTGEHADTLVVDDPVDPLGANATSGAELSEVETWWSQTVPTRFRDHARSARVVIMQRLHERDLAGICLRDGYAHLCLPMRFEHNHPQRDHADRRTASGALLCPERFPEDVVAALERVLGPRQAASQLQQRPIPAGGLIYRAEYFERRWTELPAGGTYTLSIDCAFKDSSSSSWVVVQCWYQQGPNHYLVDQSRGHWGFVATTREVMAMAARYPKALRKLVEDKANGTAIIEVLRGTMAGLEAIEPIGGKEARAHACEPLWASGHVLLPHATHAVYADGRRGAPWVQEFVGEMLSFPLGMCDDQVDAQSQYLNRMGGNRAEKLKKAMDAILG